MNSFIDNLNQWGENFLSCAWPMLWQSSLLIMGLFAFDLLFRRRVRAAIRYALWLVVLVKLCVPPTLALPTSPAWWLHQAASPAAAKPLSHYTVTYDDAPLPELPPVSLPASAPPAPVMSFAAWSLAAAAAVSSVLLGWLLVRWWQVARMVRLATAAESFSGLLENAMRLAGASETGVRAVRLKLVADQISPAVCGLFRPTILIPKSLAENFPDAQLRAVLLHELIHLRRRDVWVNCLQALLQIIYWWHPLVWFANARIRRVREEAVDDAVMLALRDEADGYAPTLLEVAKLALNRPLASLGLVGIMESRHALRQRIERLVDFRAPRHAGLTLVSLLGIVAFTAVAVPMGEGPAEQRKSSGSLGEPEVTTTSGHNVNHVENVIAPIVHSAGVSKNTNPPTILVTAHFFHMSGVDFQNVFSTWKFKRDAANAASWIAAWPQPFSSILSQLKASGLNQFSAPRAVTTSGNAVTLFIGNGTNQTEFDCTPVATNGQINLTFFYRVVEPQAGVLVTNQFRAVTLLQNHGGVVVSSADVARKSGSNLVALVSAEIVTNSARFQPRLNSVITRTNGGLTYTGPGRQNLMDKLNRIRFDSIDFDNLPLNEVLRLLSQKSQQADPEHKGINFLINPSADQSGPATASPSAGTSPGIDPITGLPFVSTNSDGDALDVGKFTVKLNLTDVRLADVLTAILDVAQNPKPGDTRTLRYSIKDYGIVFQSKTAELPQFFTRQYKVDTNALYLGLKQLESSGAVAHSDSLETFSALLQKFFSCLGVDFKSPPGKSLFFNERSGKMLVRATETDLDLIERALLALKNVTPQIHIKARFIEVPKGSLGGMQNLISATFTNPTAGSTTGILTSTNANRMLRALESIHGFESLAEPEVTTLSGRQTQMRVTQVIDVVTNLVFREDATNGPIVPQSGKVETGPILDVVPYVLADDCTINLALIPSLTEFLGYDKSTNTTTVYNRAGKKFDLPKLLPRFAVRQVVATVNLWDNQTVVLGGMSYTNVTVIKDKVPVLGDIPIISQLFRSQRKTEVEKDVLVFITATIVDPAGNRVHSDKELDSIQKGIPAQPAPPLK